MHPDPRAAVVTDRPAIDIALYSRIGYTETHRAEEKGLKRVFMVKRLD
ncbi:hypothetical protein [Paraburkholderia ginsengiterrae]|nr:hypothetical protein [Paraburkholderia ginsengiterrae]